MKIEFDFENKIINIKGEWEIPYLLEKLKLTYEHVYFKEESSNWKIKFQEEEKNIIPICPCPNPHINNPPNPYPWDGPFYTTCNNDEKCK